MTLYSGYCQGGPYHGKVLHHGKDFFEIVINNNKPLTYKASEALKADASAALKFGKYVHRSDRWVWKDRVSE